MNGSGNTSLRTYLVYLFLVVALISVAGSLGCYYFEEVANPRRHENNIHGMGDCFWWTMVTLTTIGYGDIFPVTTGGRMIAILLMLTGIGTLGVMTASIAAYFVGNNQLELLRIRRVRDHVVICGLGDEGLLLAKAFRERGQPVLVIEQNEANDRIPVCRELGAFVLIGNATDREMLLRARVQEARYLIAVCGRDGANAEVAAHARELVGQRSGRVLTCSTHIVDPELWYLLRRWEISAEGSFRLQFFNLYDLGARALLAAHPPFPDPTAPDPASAASRPNSVEAGTGSPRRGVAHPDEPESQPPTPGPPHLLIVGAGQLGQNLVVHAARQWRDRHPQGEVRLGVTIIDQDVDRLPESLYQRHPGLEHACRIEVRAMDLRSPEFHQAAFLLDAERRAVITGIYVCLDDDALALSAALALLHRARRHQIPIVVRMTQEAGLATLLHAARGGGPRGFEYLHAVGLLERTCHPELVLGGTNEILARALHGDWLREQKRLGVDPRSNPAMVPWDRLPEELKESNRNQAGHIGLKLQAIGCDLAPLTEWDAHTFSFSAEEVEKMARMEHERWVEERRAQGWKCGPRDPANKTNPNLVPWEELPEESRISNRDLICALPLTLARAGFQIYRLRGG